MKTINTLILLLTLAASSQAGTIKAIKTNGKWASKSTWDLDRVPANGDNIVIPQGFSVIMDTHEYLNNVIIKISGVLDIQDKLDLNALSLVNVYSGGLITGSSASDQIIINNLIVYKGSNANVAGPKYASSETGTGFTTLTILPVNFVNFYVSKYNSDVRLVFATATENNNNHFEIERSNDGTSWNTIGIVLGAGSSTSTNTYSYTDKNVSGKTIYYRIKQVDNSGTFAYSPVRSIKAEEVKSNTQIYTSSNTIVVKFNESKETVMVRLMNLNGQVMQQQTVNQAGTMIAMTTNVKQQGVYVVQVMDSNNITESKKIVL